MILRKRNIINNKKLKLERLNLKSGDLLIAKYPTDEYCEPLLSYEHLISIRKTLDKHFDKVMMIPDKVSFGKIHKELDNNVSVDEIIKIKEEVFKEHGYIDEWVQAECWSNLLEKLNID